MFAVERSLTHTRAGRTHGLYWVVGYTTCTALVLVPTPLVEPRYFLIPYMLLRIHAAAAVRSRRGWPWEWVEVGWNVLVNAVTVGVFLGRTFEWDGWEGPMRFMW